MKFSLFILPTLFCLQILHAADPAVQRLRADVEKFSVDFNPRSGKDLDNLNACANYIEAQFRKSGAVVNRQIFEVNGQEYCNVLARFGSRDEPLQVVGAHYDAHEGTPGADDNASGVAGLLELSRQLGKLEKPPHIELATYCLEEPPYFGSTNMGSFLHAQALKDAGETVSGMLALEMIGYFSNKSGSQQYPMPGMEKIYPNKGNFIAVISRMDQGSFTKSVYQSMSAGTDLPVEILLAPERLPGVDFSDHRNFWKFDFPAAMITDTAFMRNSEYHSSGDTPDRLDYARMAKVVDGIFHFLVFKTPAPE